jgi:hypothetical protein
MRTSQRNINLKEDFVTKESIAFMYKSLARIQEQIPVILLTIGLSDLVVATICKDISYNPQIKIKLLKN